MSSPAELRRQAYEHVQEAQRLVARLLGQLGEDFELELAADELTDAASYLEPPRPALRVVATEHAD